MSVRPFKQGRFRDLPAKPQKPHKFFEAEAIDLNLNSKLMGTMKVHIRKFAHKKGKKKKPPLFLIHGFMTTSYSWRYAFDTLGEHYTCFALDLPGAGRSDNIQAASYAPENLAEFLAEVMQALGIYGCDTIGNSMGGYLAMHLGLQHPQSMRRLINLHSPGIPEIRLELLNGLLYLPGMKALLKYIVSRDPLPFVFKNVHYYDESFKSLEEAHEYGDPLATEAGANGLVKYFDETMNINHMRSFRNKLSALAERGESFAMPLQLMYAKEDPMVSPEFGFAFKELISAAELIWLERASHFAHVDNVELFSKHALEFLKK